MESIKPNATKIATKWAVIFTITAIVLTYGLDMLNLDPNSPVKYLTYLPFIGFLVLAQKEFKDSLGGYLTFGQGFAAGFRYALFAGFLVGLFTYLYLGYLSATAMDKIVEQQQAVLTAQNKPQEQIDIASEMTRKYGAPIAGVGVAIVYLIFGCIISLIGAAILKKEPSPFDAVDTTGDEPTV
jgi:hypothetical protein